MMADYRYRFIGLLPGNMPIDVSEMAVRASRFYGIGEVGIDRRYPGIEDQVSFLKAALSLSKELKVPAVLHIVGFYEEALKAIRETGNRYFMVHGFTGSYEIASRIMDLGGLISLGPRAERCKAFSRLITLPFVTETDMKTGPEQEAALSDWNEKLSLLTGRDIESESGKAIQSFLCRKSSS